MKVIILAAGYAVRLQPLTLNTPKPLLIVGKQTIIDRILDKVDMVLTGSEPVYIITNAKFSGKFDEWLKAQKHKGKIAVINDGSTSNENRLGAIRDMGLAIDEKAIDDDLLIIAGDNLFGLDLRKFVSFASAKPDGVSVALYDVGSIEAAKNFGVVKLDKDNKVIDFEEKPQVPRSTLVSTGIYYFPKNKLSFIEKYVKMQDKLDPSTGSGSTPSAAGGINQRSRGVDAPGYYISWLSKTDRVYGYSFLGDWYDIGNIEAYRKADKKYTEKVE